MTAMIAMTDAIGNNSIKLKGVLILAGGLSVRMGSPKALLHLPNNQTLLDYHVRQADVLNVPIMIADNEQGFVSSITSTKNPVLYVKDYQPVRDISAQSFHDQSFDPQSNAYQSSKHQSSKHQTNILKKGQLHRSAGPLSAVLSGLKQALALEEEALSQFIEARAKDGWLLVISCDSLVHAKQTWDCLSQISLNDNSQVDSNEAYIKNIKANKVICFSDEEYLYPLLGLYRLDLADELQHYLTAGQRRVMSFISPFCQSVPLPKQWQALSNLNTPQDFTRACQLAF